MKVKAIIRRPITATRDLANARIFKHFAAAHHLVYFGGVDYRHDDHELVRGITASNHHRDIHYTVGTIQGRDVIVLFRRSTLRFPGKAEQSYSWLIMQFDLRHTHLPRLFIDAKQHDDVFYATIGLLQPKLEDLTSYLIAAGHPFGQGFRVFGNLASLDYARQALHAEIIALLPGHFSEFDFEIDDDTLLIYAKTNQVLRGTLDDMARIGLWLADQLDKASSQPE